MSDVKAMIKSNFELSKGLNKENDIIYTDIVCYLRVSLLEEVKTEEIIADILDMFLRSQEQGKAIREIIGEDYKAFCDSILESLEPKKFSFKSLKENAEIIINGLFILLTIDIMFSYLPKLIKSKDITQYSLNASFLINSAIIIILAIGIVNYIGKNSFKLTKSKPKKITYFFIWLGFSAFILGTMFISFKLSKYPLFSLNIYFVIVPVALYWIYKGYSKFKGVSKNL